MAEINIYGKLNSATSEGIVADASQVRHLSGVTVKDSIESLVTQVGGKVDKVTGKGLSTNDFTNLHKEKCEAAVLVSPQTISEAYKAQARTNIDVPSTSGYYEDMGVGYSSELRTESVVSESEFTSRSSGGVVDVKSGFAVIRSIKGRTIAMNQLAQNGDFASTTGWLKDNVTLTVSDNIGVVTLVGVTGGSIYRVITVKSGHKYYFAFSAKKESGNVNKFSICFYHNSQRNSEVQLAAFTNYARLETMLDSDFSGTTRCLFSLYSTDTTGVAKIRDYVVMDLTEMFGAGNEPSTCLGVRKYLPLDYYQYNEGSLVSNCYTGIKTTGFNLFDEEQMTSWSGVERVSNGWRGLANSFYRSGTPICTNTFGYTGRMCVSFKVSGIVPSTSGEIVNPMFLFSYTDGTYSYVKNVASNDDFEVTGTSAAGKVVKSISFTYSNYGTITIERVCLSFSWSGYRDGQYEKYWENTLSLPPKSFFDVTYTDKYGASHVAGGLKSAGPVYDEQTGTKDVRRIGVADLGSLNWVADGQLANQFRTSDINSAKLFGYSVCARYKCTTAVGYNDLEDKELRITNSQVIIILRIKDTAYSDAAAFKASLSGVMLYFELAEPVSRDAEDARYVYYPIDDFGTEEAVPSHGDTPSSGVLRADIEYDPNIGDAVRRLSFDAVRTVPQSFTSSQKSVAVSNIGAASASDIASVRGELSELRVGGRVVELADINAGAKSSLLSNLEVGEYGYSIGERSLVLKTSADVVEYAQARTDVAYKTSDMLWLGTPSGTHKIEPFVKCGRLSYIGGASESFFINEGEFSFLRVSGGVNRLFYYPSGCSTVSGAVPSIEVPLRSGMVFNYGGALYVPNAGLTDLVLVSEASTLQGIADFKNTIGNLCYQLGLSMGKTITIEWGGTYNSVGNFIIS